MSTNSSLVFLGTGGSMGIPVIGCECQVCRSDSPFNKRLRPSALLKTGEKVLLLDAGPDLRVQALRLSLRRLDGVILTHAHNDHIAGLDELRCFYMYDKQPMPLLVSMDTLEDIALRFPYLFKGDPRTQGLVTQFAIQKLEEDRGSTQFAGIDLQYVSYEQCGMKVNGFRVGDLAYISDIRKYPESIFEDLSGVKNLVVTALRHEATPMHFSIDEAVEFVERVGAQRAWLSHIAHELDHEKTNGYLPPHIRLAYDGLEVPFLSWAETKEQIT